MDYVLTGAWSARAEVERGTCRSAAFAAEIVGDAVVLEDVRSMVAHDHVATASLVGRPRSRRAGCQFVESFGAARRAEVVVDGRRRGASAHRGRRCRRSCRRSGRWRPTLVARDRAQEPERHQHRRRGDVESQGPAERETDRWRIATWCDVRDQRRQREREVDEEPADAHDEPEQREESQGRVGCRRSAGR